VARGGPAPSGPDPQRRRVITEQAERLWAQWPNQVWAIDFQFDETADGRRVKLANIVDEHTREALAMRVGRTCTADDLIEVLAGLVTVRGAPEHLRMDNGPELLAWALRDYCRLAGTHTTYIEPGAPWENPYLEAFNGRVRDELLNIEEFTSLTVAQVVVEAWRIEYNTYQPHSALGGLTPPSTRPTGPAPTNPHSHSEWTTNRGPITSRPTESLAMSATTPPLPPRLRWRERTHPGALLSSGDYGSSVEGTAKLHPLWQVQAGRAGASERDA
jgi:putative transposase